MKKLYMTLGLLCAAAFVYVGFFYQTCEQPTPDQVDQAKLSCALQILGQIQADPQPIIDEICKEKGAEPGCELSKEQDEEVVQRVLNLKIKGCIVKNLESGKLCTDKVTFNGF